MVERWLNSCKRAEIPTSDRFSLLQVLGDPVKLRQWSIWGLPRDAFSSCNAVIMERSNAWPLCIDPQGQTNRWIRAMHVDELVVIKPTGAHAVARCRGSVRCERA